jgi:hypothetical protein
VGENAQVCPREALSVGRQHLSPNLRRRGYWSPLPPLAAPVAGGRVTLYLCSGLVVRARKSFPWHAVGVVGATLGRINLPYLHSHTRGVLHGGISEVMASCACRSFRSAAFGFMDGVGEAAAAPSDVVVLLFCPRC